MDTNSVSVFLDSLDDTDESDVEEIITQIMEDDDIDESDTLKENFLRMAACTSEESENREEFRSVIQKFFR